MEMLEIQDTRLKTLEERILTMERRTERGGIVRFLVSHWVLLSFLFALAVAVYAKLAFDIDYFEQYRNASATKHISAYYQQLGDRLLSQQEWEGAAVAYRRAAQINPNNIAAQQGLLKSEIFDPLPGQQFTAHEVSEARLNYLSELFPDDKDILFLRASAAQQQGDLVTAARQFQELLKRDPDSASAHLMLGYVYHTAARLDDAIVCYQRAVNLAPRMAAANNNLGFCYLLKRDYPKAVEYLTRALTLSNSTLTALSLGDAHRYEGRYDTALEIHQIALANIELAIEGGGRERFVSGEWTYNYMPVSRSDSESTANYVLATTVGQKQAIAHLALAIDMALQGAFSTADQHLERALHFESTQSYRLFYANRLASAAALVSATPEVKTWLRARQLAVGKVAA